VLKLIVIIIVFLALSATVLRQQPRLVLRPTGTCPESRCLLLGLDREADGHFVWATSHDGQTTAPRAYSPQFDQADGLGARRNLSSPTDARFHRTFAQRLYVLSGQTNATQRSYSARTPLRQSLQGGTHASGKVLSGFRNAPKPHQSRRRSPRGKHLAASSDQAPRRSGKVVCARTAFTWRSSQAGR